MAVCVDDIIFDGTAFSVKHWAQFLKDEFVCEARTVMKGYPDEMLLIIYQLIYDAARPAIKPEIV